MESSALCDILDSFLTKDGVILDDFALSIMNFMAV